MDLRLLEWITAHRSDALTDLARVLMAGGGAAVLGVGLAAAFVLGIAVDQVGAVWMTVVAGGSASAVATALKSVVDRPRPPADLALVTASGTSMPSTIAALTAGAALALVLVMRWPGPGVRRAAAVVLALVVALVGAAMIYLGAHWLTDVLAGWAVGAATAVAVAVPRAADSSLSAGHWSSERTALARGATRVPTSSTTSSGPLTVHSSRR